MEKFLGIDIGGTNVKFGLVDSEGNISMHHKVPTVQLRKNGEFIAHFIDYLQQRLPDYQPVHKIGIGVPGTLNKTRTKTLEIPAIPELNGKEFKAALEDSFPDYDFSLENDANAAALGEFYFSKDNSTPEDYIFVTMGTGIGGAAILDGQIFKGGDGNSMEIGHMFSNNNTLEKQIGRMGILNLTESLLPDYPDTSLITSPAMSIHELVAAAGRNDELSCKVFHRIGAILGEALVSVIRILDVKTIIIGGGISASFDYIAPGFNKALSKYLTEYYLDSLQVKRAALQNESGIVGAAALCFVSKKVIQR